MFKKSRGISPIFAVLILIAIAVVGGVVIYLYTSGYLGGMTGGGGVGQEKVAIEAVVYNGTAVTLHCKSIAGGDIIVEDAILKDSSGETIEVLTLGTPVTLPAAGTMTEVDCVFNAIPLTSGDSYSVILVSKAGNQFVSTSFKA